MDNRTPNASRRRLFVNRQGSAERVETRSLCQAQNDCGSCQKLDEPYNLQLSAKTKALRELQATVQAPLLKQAMVRDCIPSPQTQGYRHTAKLVVAQDRPAPAPAPRRGGSEGPARRWINIGLYKPTTHRVVDIGRCLVQSDRINEVVAWLRSELGKQDISIYNERTRRGLLRYLVVRSSASNGQVLVTFVTTADDPCFKPFARELSNRFSFVNGVLLHVNKTAGNAIFASGDDEQPLGDVLTLAGVDSLQEEVCGLNLRVSAMSFMQVNPKVAERLYYRMVELAEPRGTENVLDLYSGVGTIGLAFARHASRVFGIEETPSSVRDAIHNAQQNGICNMEFHTGRAEDLLSKMKVFEPGTGIVTLNPSRRGCQKAVLEHVATLKPRQMLYMSCNPKTLIRDLEILEGLGYRTTSLEPFDMFPQTPHFEVLAHLVPANRP